MTTLSRATATLIAASALVASSAPIASASTADDGVQTLRQTLLTSAQRGDGDARRILSQFDNLPQDQKREFVNTVSNPDSMKKIIQDASSKASGVNANFTPKSAKAAASSSYYQKLAVPYSVLGIKLGTFNMEFGWTFAGTTGKTTTCRGFHSGSTWYGSISQDGNPDPWSDGPIAHCQINWKATYSYGPRNQVWNLKHHAWGYPFGGWKNEMKER